MPPRVSVVFFVLLTTLPSQHYLFTENDVYTIETFRAMLFIESRLLDERSFTNKHKTQNYILVQSEYYLLDSSADAPEMISMSSVVMEAWRVRL